MALPVKLSDLVDQMEMSGDDWTLYLNRKTGEIVSVSPDDEILMGDPPDLENAPAWQVEQLAKVREALESDDDLVLPDKFEIHEWSIMERFVGSIDNDEHRNKLDRAIHGNGAFRRFKDTLHDLKLQDDWYRFRARAMEDIAAAWLEENSIPFQRGDT